MSKLHSKGAVKVHINKKWLNVTAKKRVNFAVKIELKSKLKFAVKIGIG